MSHELGGSTSAEPELGVDVELDLLAAGLEERGQLVDGLPDQRLELDGLEVERLAELVGLGRA